MGYFVYKTTNVKNGKIYIGVHRGERDDGYLGSGNLIKRAIKKHGVESFVREILFEYERLEDALLKESEIVNPDFIKRPDVYNLVVGGGMPPTFVGAAHPLYGVKRPDQGMRMRDNNPMARDDVREKIRGTAVYSLHDGSKVRARKDDPRVASGEAVHVNAGKVTVRDPDGKVFRVSSDHPRYLSGELVHVMVGTKRTPESVERWRLAKYGVATVDELRAIRAVERADRKKNKPIVMVTCPHCGKTARKTGAMARFHFDNCRNKS